VFPEGLAGLPQWLIDGVLLGVAGSAVVAVLFYVLVRHLPAATRETGAGHSGEARRRAEIGRYLSDIGERYATDHDLGAETVAFYLPERGVAITFDAGAYYRLLGTEVEPVLVEHELPGHRLGARLPFETPAVDGADAAGGQIDGRANEEAFAALGLPAGASTEEITAAYRRKVKEVHPDHGGDREDFHRVREAYATAKRRAN
jgi:hypothetical protein